MTRTLFSLIACSLLLNAPAFAQVEVVAKYRATYGPQMARNEIVALLTDVARELNQQQPIYGILRKPAGNNCGGYSCDIICSIEQPMRQWDVLIDVEGHAVPSWRQVPPAQVNEQDGCEYVPPYVTPNPGTPVPTPGTSCPECPPDQREAVARLQADVLSLLAERDALLNRPPPRCTARLFGVIPVPCKVIP